EAKSLARRSVDITRQALGEKHVYLLGSLEVLAHVLRVQRQFAEAEAVYRQSLALAVEGYGEANPAGAPTLEEPAATLGEEERFDEAEPLLRRALDFVGRAADADAADVVSVLLHLGQLHVARKDFLKARDVAQQAVGHARGVAEGRPGLLAPCLLYLGE